MQIEPYIHSLGQHLKARFGRRVRKLSLHAGMSCPNRDGTLGRGGCTFCNVRAFNEGNPALSVREQIEAGKASTGRAQSWLAYFQAYTSTWAEIERLQQLYDEALQQADIVGLCVGTRPDCVPDAVLRLLAAYRQRGAEVWLELGLQSAHDTTLAQLRRAHAFSAYADAVARAKAHEVPVCTHLMLGLPGETPAMMEHTLHRVLDCGVHGLKLHPLMIVRGSRMAAQHARGEIQPLTLDAYADIAARLIRLTPRPVVLHRVSATARVPTLIAPSWCEGQWPAINAIAARLERDGSQGSQSSEYAEP